MSKKISLMFICLSLVVVLALGLSSCGSAPNDQDDGEQTQINTETGGQSSNDNKEEEHVHSGGEATCSSQAICEACGEAYGEKASDKHSASAEWTKTDTSHKKIYTCCGAVAVSEEAHKWQNGTCSDCSYACLHSGGAATCEQKAICSICASEYGELALEHRSGDEYQKNTTHHWHTTTCTHTDVLVGYEAHEYVSAVTASTCISQGYTTFTCKCGDSYVFDYVGAVGHVYSDSYEYNDSQHWRNATCEHTGEKTELEAHNYTAVTTLPTCTEKGYTTYTCECGYTYVADYVDAAGHTVDNWTQNANPTLYDESLCKYAITYNGSCSECGAGQTKTEYVEKHSLYWTVFEVSDCQNPNGKKVQVCTAENCIYHDPETPMSEESYSDPDNHSWDDGVISGSVKTYTCINCSGTKTVIESSNNEASMSGDDIQNVDEVNISGITIGFDDSAKGNISQSTSVTIGAQTYEDDEKQNKIANSNLTDDQIAQIGDKPIYDFTVNNGDVSSLGGNATIRIPYELSPGENPEEIVVWYISDGEITPVLATYSNGFVEFTTDHFSYYTAAPLTPAQYCKIYNCHERGIGNRQTIEPTCTTEGYTICLRCGEIVGKTAPLGHEWHTEVIKEATCDTNGVVKYACVLCEMGYEMPIVAIGHQYVLDSQVEATCTKNGSVTYKCRSCLDEYSSTLKQKDHQYIPNVKPATCTDEGYTEHTCITCGNTLIKDGVEALGHKFDNVWHTGEEGHYHVCMQCSARGELHIHEEGPAATEQTAQICTVCEYIITPPIVHVHKPVKVDAKKTSCTENGNIEYYKCECGKWFADEACQKLITDHTSVYILTEGHKVESVDAVEPTCTASGYTAGLYCSVCEQYLKGHVEISPRGHSYAITEQAPTCTADGETVYTCKCGDTYSEPIEKLEHRYSIKKVAPTCTEGGYTDHTCVFCNDNYKDNLKDALDHKYSDKWTVTENGHSRKCIRCDAETDKGAHIPDHKEATEQYGVTCTVCGYVIENRLNHTHTARRMIDAVEPSCTASGRVKHYVCDCGDLFYDEGCTKPVANKADTILSALGHTSRIVKGTEPTCTENGYTDGIFCDRCNTWEKSQNTISSLGHASRTVNGKEATCTEGGYTDGIFCDRCNTWEKEQVPTAKLGHASRTVEGKESTCTEGGYTDGIFCDRCNTWEKEQAPTAKLGHASRTVKGKEATCTEGGYTDGIFCDRCNTWLEEQIFINPLGHVDEFVEGKAATCIAGGYTDGVICSVCNTWISEQEEIPIITDHYAMLTTGKDPTCTELGYTPGYYCPLCCVWQGGHDEIPALGHSAKHVDKTPATCTSYGFEAGEYCGQCYTWLEGHEEIEPLGHLSRSVEGKAPICTEDGYTDGIFCDRCEIWVSGHEILKSSGHDYVDGECTHCGDIKPVIENLINVKITENEQGNAVMTLSISDVNMSGIWIEVFYGKEYELIYESALNDAVYNCENGRVKYTLVSEENLDQAEIELFTIELNAYNIEMLEKNIKITVKEIYVYGEDYSLNVPNYTIGVNK